MNKSFLYALRAITGAILLLIPMILMAICVIIMLRI